MPKLHEVVGKSRDTEVLINGLPVQITYDPNEYTAEAEAFWNEQMVKGTAGAIAVDFLCRLLKYWDLEEDDTDKLVPITPERIGKISLLVLNDVMEGIFKDIDPSQQSGPPNRATRRAAAKSRS